MANYVEYVKVANGESWPVRDVEAQDAIAALETKITDDVTNVSEQAKLYTDEQVASSMESADSNIATALETAKTYTDNNAAGKMQVLWNNPSPTVAVGNGDVTTDVTITPDVDLAGYTVFIVECRHTTTYGYANTCMIIGRGASGSVYFPAATFGRLALASTHRYFTINSGSNAVTCSQGYSNGTVSPTACIPVRIYGIKM